MKKIWGWIRRYRIRINIQIWYYTCKKYGVMSPQAMAQHERIEALREEWINVTKPRT